MATLDQVQNQAKDFIAGLTVTQRLLLAGAVVVSVAVLALFTHLIGAPEFKPLVTGMEATDAEALGARLAVKSIPYQISPDGKSVSVPSDKLDSSRMEIASQGMPRSGRFGFELFDKVNWGQTEFDEKVNYQRALEGELERSIQTLKDVESARVHLVLPTDSIFLDKERTAKASVVLTLRSGKLSEETQLGIARLVAGAVDKLQPEDVTVIDAETNRPLGMPKHDVFSSDGNLEQELSKRLVATLEPVVGSDHVRASVNVDYDSSTSEENQESYDPKSAVAVTMQRSEEQVGGALNGGVPGTSSNVPTETAGSKPVVVTGDGNQTSKSESSTFAVNRVVRHTTQPAGRIRRITAALLVDDAVEMKQESGKSVASRRPRTAEELKQINELASAAIGLDTSRGDSLAVKNLLFAQPAIEASPAKLNKFERVRVILNDYSNIVRYGAMLLLFLLAYLLMLRPLKKQLLTTFRELPTRVAAQRSSLPSLDNELGISGEAAALSSEQQRTLAMKKHLIEKTKDGPAATGKLIQAWLHEGGK
jgi:flagellar M-ring protein FliF